MGKFKVESDFEPAGDQPQAIEKLLRFIGEGRKYITLLGVTGSGKTFTIAKVIEQLNRPVLVISHNKTLSAQLFGEFKGFFPENAVEYFVSYYDYYQPEAYLPAQDVYIEKDADINEQIDKLRLRATTALVSRRDVIVVASVSCIYGLGSPDDYFKMTVVVRRGRAPGDGTTDTPPSGRDDLMRALVDIHYARNAIDFAPGTFRTRGDVVEIFPPYDDKAIRVEYWGDTPERISVIDPLTGELIQEVDSVAIFAARHFVTTKDKVQNAVMSIRKELAVRLKEFRDANKLVEAQRLEMRTNFDIEMMLEIGYCKGIENYSRHISGRAPGERPAVLLDYFPKDLLVIVDESHATLPQIRGMFHGDRARKETLVEYGFRLPSAFDNRPLYFDEFLEMAPQIVFMSATPGDFELEQSGDAVVELIVRPTGLIDPEIEIRPAKGQVEDILKECRERAGRGERVLITTLTKRMAEQLADYLTEYDVRARYLHSDIDALERVDILRDLRLGNFDVLVGVNLLREGLDLPEVSLVAILDADKPGFLRSERSLIQVAGRSARHIAGKVILYADGVSDAMAKALSETARRRKKQLAYNEEHSIEPKGIVKSVEQILATTQVADSYNKDEQPSFDKPNYLNELPIQSKVDELIRLMKQASKELNFEYAAYLRDEIKELEENLPVKRLSKRRREKKGTQFYGGR